LRALPRPPRAARGGGDAPRIFHGQEPAAVARNMTQTQALLAFKASGGAANAEALASWTDGTDPCGGKWAGVTCSGGTNVSCHRLAQIVGQLLAALSAPCIHPHYMVLAQNLFCYMAARTQAFTYRSSTLLGTCGENIITDEATCTAAAAALGREWGSVTGPEWESGCIFRDGSVYFSPVEDGSADQPTEAYICMSGEPGRPAPIIGYISVIDLCDLDGPLTVI
jgi:hypothetical protein